MTSELDVVRRGLRAGSGGHQPIVEAGLMQKAAGWTEELHPRGFHGKWMAKMSEHLDDAKRSANRHGDLMRLARAHKAVEAGRHLSAHQQISRVIEDARKTGNAHLAESAIAARRHLELSVPGLTSTVGGRRLAEAAAKDDAAMRKHGVHVRIEGGRHVVYHGDKRVGRVRDGKSPTAAHDMARRYANKLERKGARASAKEKVGAVSGKIGLHSFRRGAYSVSLDGKRVGGYVHQVPGGGWHAQRNDRERKVKGGPYASRKEAAAALIQAIKTR